MAGKGSFAFVRNPLEWYRSWWLYRVRVGLGRMPAWSGEQIAYDAWDEVFNRFVLNVTELQPGFLTRLFERYVGTRERPLVDRIGRVETLRSDLKQFLGEFGETVPNPNVMDELADYNTNGRGAPRPPYEPHALQRVVETERTIFERFNYPETVA